MASSSASRSLCLFLFIQLVSSVSTWSVGQQVDTTSGPVTGHGASLYTEVSEYLGIPYAAPPIGDLRWALPQPVKKSEKVLSATKFGPSCAAARASKASSGGSESGIGGSLGEALGQRGQTFSEDCLTINVWSKPQVGEKKKAVLVWIYGGGFTSGSTNSTTYNGQVFAEKQDVVVVTFNYRLNVFGFPSAPGLPELNFGLYDQRKATEWVRDNIEAFGGDSKRITIFGESAGSRSVDIYAYAWASAADPIINGFVSESGSAPFTTGAPHNLSIWYTLSSRLGCGTADKGEATLACMRGKAMENIVTAASQKPSILARFSPVVDGKTYFSDYENRAKAGKFIQRPILIGNNDNEAGLFAMGDTIQGMPQSAQAELLTNLGYNCASGLAAQRRLDKGIHAWRYRWMGVFANQRLSATSGAYHSSEIPYVFGLPDGVMKTRPPVENQKKVAEVMNTAWAAFAKDPVDGLSKFGWPVYDPAGNTLVQLAENNGPGVTFSKGDKYDEQCGMIKNNVPGYLQATQVRTT